MAGVIVIGAGQAAASFAAKFRSIDQTTSLTIIGDEPVIPYQRPPLSKKYATGEMDLTQLLLKPKNWYQDNDVDLKTGSAVTAINRQDKTVLFADGQVLPWEKLIFATGSRARALPDAVTKGLNGIFYLRNIADADKISGELKPGRKVVIIGGGYIGLEAAAVCAQKGLDVCVVEAASRILERVACKETSDWFRAIHQDKGVQFYEGSGVRTLSGDAGSLTSVTLDDQTIIEADFALVGIGILPNVELAQAIGLTCDGGIHINGICQTEDPDIFAAGDCALFPYKGMLTRLESVPNAIDQANIAAQNVCGNRSEYIAKPWFWSDQYDVKLQIAGLNRGYDHIVVRPGSKPNSAAHFYYQGDQLLAVDAMNEPRVYMVAKRMIEAGKTIARDDAANPELDLKSLM